jgi:hypothetical protein
LGAEDQFEKSRKEGQRERERESLLLDLTVLTFTALTNHCRDRDPKKLQFLEPKRGITEVFFSVLYRNFVQPFRLFSRYFIFAFFFFFYLGFWVLFKIQLL